MIITRIESGYGKDYADNEVFFFDNGLIHIKDNEYYVQENAVIAVNKVLFKQGVLCERVTLKQKAKHFIIGEQEYYKVLYSCTKEIPAGCIVIVRERTSYKTKHLYYFDESNILLMLSKNTMTIAAGPQYCILNTDHEGYDQDNIENVTKGKNEQGELVYFGNFTLRFYIKGVLKLLIKKKDIILTAQKELCKVG